MSLCIANIHTANILPVKGLNVYDILKHRTLVFTRASLNETIDRLRRPALRCFKPKDFDWKVYLEQQADQRAAERQRRFEVAQWLQERGVEVPKMPRAPRRAAASGALRGGGAAVPGAMPPAAPP